MFMAISSGRGLQVWNGVRQRARGIRTCRMPQPQGVCDHRDRRERHRSSGQCGRQQEPPERIEHACRHRDQQRVVAKGPAEVLADIAHCRPADGKSAPDRIQGSGG
eukprot:TRINITY_DN16000_c0_g1_i1.p5 TRINITY_DN16000_c0_g1~~TRINITY_DN16000_c0_g1_i1.p5  ORF type:complete len:106 (+),score=0.23 TRINITY_DN16000_c0_g1_i1:553-870(+)